MLCLHKITAKISWSVEKFPRGAGISKSCSWTRNCYRRKSRHLNNCVDSEVPSSFLFKLTHQSLICFPVAPYLATFGNLCGRFYWKSIFLSFQSSKIKSTWRSSEAVVQRCSVKKVFLTISQNLLEVSTWRSFRSSHWRCSVRKSCS